MKQPKPVRPFIDAAAFADADAYAALLAAPLPVMPLLAALDLRGSRPDVVAPQTVLTRDEERAMFLAYNAARRELVATGDARWATRAEHLREYLVRTNLPLVAYAYGRFRLLTKTLDPDALASDGMAALLRAIEGFDVARGFKFSTYAVHSLFNSIRNVGERTRREGHRLPLVPGDDVDTETTANEGDDPAHALAKREELEQLRAALASDVAGLSENERHVLARRYFDDDTLDAIGAALGVSKERIRQIQIVAMKKLRRYMTTGVASRREPSRAAA